MLSTPTNTMKLVAWLAGLIACTAAQKCCPPKQFEAFMGEVGGTCTPQGQSGLFFVTGQVHYDYKKAMVAAEEYISTEKQVKVQIIQDYNSNTQYVVQAGKCTKSDLPGSIENTCVPDYAVYGGRLVYGLNAALEIDMYSFEGQQLGTNYSVQVLVTSKECLYFAQNTFIDSPQVDIIMNSGYTNTTLGIKDPSVFDVPKICDHGDVIPFKAMHDIIPDRMKWLLIFGAR
ncbi:ependymin-related protein 2-like [Saccoglossus kowalevskii]|uniref:Ependymin-related protein 1-like n=1 Tax=Saccoglossus kowalevskii TaxID=10224 RepID=A0ABM0GLS5_SACKO|nr:PREDICTED: ependymin-related protein 1-like [Saccoglossus kowalevskii]